jgi:putative heme iron utilization protein
MRTRRRLKRAGAFGATTETERSVTDEVPGRRGFSARCLLRAARHGVLATLAQDQPFASLVTPAVLPDGSVLMLLSSLASHTRHLLAAPRCALMVAGPPLNANPQTAPRLTLTGVAAQQQDHALRQYWVQRHPYAAFYADFTDFSIWRLVPEAAHYVGGFAMASVLARDSLLPEAAHVADIEQAAARIIGHCNTDHPDALARLARSQGHTGDWRMIGVDVDGFDLVQDDRVLRIAFDAPVEDAPGVRAALVRLVQTTHDGG